MKRNLMKYNFSHNFSRFSLKISIILICSLFFISCKQDSGSTYLSKATRLYEEGKIDEAKIAYQEGIKENPKNTELILRYGNLLEDKKDFDGAKTQYEKVLSIKKNHIMGMVNLAIVYRKKGQLKRAIEIMESALSNKSEGWMQDVLGNMYDENKQFAEAKKWYELAVKSEPNEPEFVTDLANLKLKIGDKKGALSDFKKIRQMLSDLPSDSENATKDYNKQLTYVSDMISILERN